MKIGLMNLEPKIENTALMQISNFHKGHGDSVEWYSPLFYDDYDHIYGSSLFTFTKKPVLKPKMVVGGTGFNACSKLPPEIESSNLDYSIYPNCKTSYIWFSRGCNNHCPFCIVPTKEGKLTLEVPKNLNPNASRISVMDNSFTQLPKDAFHRAIMLLEDLGYPIDWQCGIDCRIVDEDKWNAIRGLRRYKQLRTAWDNPRENLLSNLEIMGDFFGKSALMVYVLIGFWSTPQEDLYRVKVIQKLGLDPWVMPYDKKDPYQRAFERWANRHAGCEWQDYEYGSWKKSVFDETFSLGQKVSGSQQK